jgi:hypothetical protein
MVWTGICAKNAFDVLLIFNGLSSYYVKKQDVITRIKINIAYTSFKLNLLESGKEVKMQLQTLVINSSFIYSIRNSFLFT